MVILSGKRAEEVEDPSWHHRLTHASRSSGSDSVQLPSSPQRPPGSLSASDDASGVPQETSNPTQLPSHASGGTDLSWYSDGIRKLSGGTKPPGYSGTTKKLSSATSVRTKTNKGVGTTKIEPASSSSGETTPASSSKVLPPSEEITPVSSTNSDQLPSSASGKLKPPPYASGGTDLPWYSDGIRRLRPLGGTELSSFASDQMRRPPYTSGGTKVPWYPGTTKKPSSVTSVRTKTNKWVGTTEIEPSSSSSGEITLTSSSKALPPSEEITPVSSTNSDQLPSSASGELRPPPYASGGTDLPWYSDGIRRLRPSGGTELSLSASGQMRRPLYASGGTRPPWYSGTTKKFSPATSVRTKTNKWVGTTEIEPSSSSSGEITPASPSKVLPPSELEGYSAQTPTEQLKPPSQFEKFLNDLASESKFRPRISATARGAVNAARRESQGMVHTEAYVSTSLQVTNSLD